MIYLLFSIILILIAYSWYQSHLMQKLRSKGIDDVQWTISFYTKCGEAKEQDWNEERQQLLDRIQESNYTKVGYENLESVISKEREVMQTERREWTIERLNLLDRIQAPSFDHLKQAEVRIIKAQKEEPAVKYDLV